MTRKFKEKTLVIASNNKGKIIEIEELLKPFGIEVRSGAEFGFESPEENGSTFLANAEIKSRFFAEKTGLPSLADDSGLAVDALGGAPGIYSARWAGESGDFKVAMKKIQEELQKIGSVQGQKAHFVSALSLTWADGHTEQFEGKVFGSLTFPPRGDRGFGYDPIFIPDGYGYTFAEMSSYDKYRISHRTNAFEGLVEGCFSSD